MLCPSKVLERISPSIQDSVKNHALCSIALSLQVPLMWGSFSVFLCLYSIGIFGEQGHLFYRMLLSLGLSDVSTWLDSVLSEYPVNPIGNFSETHTVHLHLTGPSDMPPSFWGGVLCSFLAQQNVPVASYSFPTSALESATSLSQGSPPSGI